MAPFSLGLECSSVCTPSATGVQQFITQYLEALLAKNNASPIFDPILYYRLSRWKKRAYRYRTDNVRHRWHPQPFLNSFRRVDLFHGLDSRRFRGKGVRQVVTVYDVAVLKDETQFEGYATDSFRQMRRGRLQEITDRGDTIISISESTKQDIVDIFRYDESRIHVIPPGIQDRFINYAPDEKRTAQVLHRYALEAGRFFLFVGQISPRKNVLGLVRAYARSRFRDNVQLVLAGPLLKEAGPVLEEIERNGLKDAVKLLGFVPDADLPALYSGARAFLFPTYYEGFGLPILESMACGTPVLIGNRGAAPEVAGGRAVVCDPFDVDSIASKIEEVADAPRDGIEAAREYAHSFKWERTAEQTCVLYRDLMEAG